jgi:hypothetical protein
LLTKLAQTPQGTCLFSLAAPELDQSCFDA